MRELTTLEESLRRYAIETRPDAVLRLTSNTEVVTLSSRESHQTASQTRPREAQRSCDSPAGSLSAVVGIPRNGIPRSEILRRRVALRSACNGRLKSFSGKSLV